VSNNSLGGTKKWCPHCKSIQICTATNPSRFGERSGQRWYKPEHPDLHFFRRALVCQTCYGTWLTAEIEESFLDELIELRDALSEIKGNAEAYIRESNRAARSLTKLTESLNILRALSIYRTENPNEAEE
jgi:hypothetical protein